MKSRAEVSATRRADTSPGEQPGADGASSLPFEQLLADLSVGLVGVASPDPDGEVRRWLEHVVSALAVDVAVVIETLGERTIRITHAYDAAGRDGVLPERLELDAPGLAERLASGGVTVLGRPAVAVGELGAFAHRGVHTIIICPVVVAGTVSGAVAFASTGRGRDWPDVLVGRLTVVGRMLAAALARRRAEDRLAADARRQHAELAHVARVSAMGEIAAAIAHELNQPLTAIRTNAQATRKMLARGRVDPAEHDEALADITADAIRAGEIIRRLRDMLRKGEAERRRVDVNALVREIEPFARADVLQHDVVLVLELAASLPGVLGDRIQLQQVVLNLVRNASEAMRGAARRDVLVSTTLAGPQTIELTVRDCGPPLSDEEFARMFQPFYTTKPGGLGIGLSLSRSIIEAHGGLLWATRNVGEPGLTMHCTLPTDPGPS